MAAVSCMFGVYEPTPRIELPRWLVTITYRHEHKDRVVTDTVDELEEIAAIVEAGPCWDTVVDIVVTRINAGEPDLTVEAAARR